ncbi:MAG: proline--tRNA ligase [Bacilli bacterium]|nr:proline--tRNA ligase [Bacilli bacterium]
MKASKMLISTLKEAPNEAIIDSHILLLRAGMVRKLVSGVYNYMPMGKRVLNKIQEVIRKHMDEAGALEILCSAVQPKELWEESGRWYKYGPELMRFKDRHDRDFCLGPTHEEIFTDIIKNEVKSYKNLPLNIYQIQTKYRDEMRPRFGLIRSREFLMKDAYSFDVDEEGLDKSYELMKETYKKIFDELHLHYQIVLADTGAIGGNGSHQFMALSDVGEGNIVYCDSCGYAADEEKAESKMEPYNTDVVVQDLDEVHTPNARTIEEVSSFLNISEKDLAKCLIYYARDKYVCVLIRGDRDVNEIKLGHALDVAEFELRLASDREIEELGLVKGFMGPRGMPLEIIMDLEIAEQKNFVTGANKADYHLINANLDRDFKVNKIADIRLAKDGDICAICGKPMKGEKGTEVGQIFKLQDKYSSSMNCTYLDENGVNKPMIMGCYGIGVSRTLQSIIDQYHDEYGIKWPVNVAPYHLVVVPVNYKDEEMKKLSDEIYNEYKKLDNEVILDDRDYKPGFKFKDWDLIGIPYMIIVGRRANEGIVEVKDRYTNEKVEMYANDAIEMVNRMIKYQLGEEM